MKTFTVILVQYHHSEESMYFDLFKDYIDYSEQMDMPTLLNRWELESRFHVHMDFWGRGGYANGDHLPTVIGAGPTELAWATSNEEFAEEFIKQQIDFFQSNKNHITLGKIQFRILVQNNVKPPKGDDFVYSHVEDFKEEVYKSDGFNPKFVESCSKHLQLERDMAYHNWEISGAPNGNYNDLLVHDELRTFKSTLAFFPAFLKYCATIKHINESDWFSSVAEYIMSQCKAASEKIISEFHDISAEHRYYYLKWLKRHFEEMVEISQAYDFKDWPREMHPAPHLFGSLAQNLYKKYTDKKFDVERVECRRFADLFFTKEEYMFWGETCQRAINLVNHTIQSLEFYIFEEAQLERLGKVGGLDRYHFDSNQQGWVEKRVSASEIKINEATKKLISSAQIENEKKEVRWIGTQAQLACFIHEFVNKGYLTLPQYRGDPNYKASARAFYDMLKPTGTFDAFYQTLNPETFEDRVGKNTRETIKLPDSSDTR